MHPVAVLLILLIAEHLFGIWGLILAVPIAAFLLRHIFRGEPVTPSGQASAEATELTEPAPRNA